jgi:hypothetical protein
MLLLDIGLFGRTQQLMKISRVPALVVFDGGSKIDKVLVSEDCRILKPPRKQIRLDIKGRT